MDRVGVPTERGTFDVERLAWFEAETGLVLPDDFRYALPRMAGFGHNVLLPVPGKLEWWNGGMVDHASRTGDRAGVSAVVD